MTDDEPEGKQRWERIVKEYAVKAYEVQEEYDSEGVEGYVSNETHKRLATVAVSYHRALKEYRDEAIIEDGDLPDVAYLKQRLGQKITRKTKAPGRSSGVTGTSVPAITEVPAGQIDNTIDELHDFRHKLGFTAKAADSTPRTSIDEDLVEEVEEWRQKNLE